MEITLTAPAAHNMRSPELATEITTAEPSLDSVAPAIQFTEDGARIFLDRGAALL